MIAQVIFSQSLSDCRKFFLTPVSTKQRQYEALRAYFVEGRPSREVARDFGYSAGSFQVLCHHFRREADPAFFVSPRPGPRDQPKKSAAHDVVVERGVDPNVPNVTVSIANYLILLEFENREIRSERATFSSM